MVRDETQRSSASCKTSTPFCPAPCGCEARQTLPFGDGPAMGSTQARLGAAQSMSLAQRHRPWASPAFSLTHVVVPGQSALESQLTPWWIGSIDGQLTLQLTFDGMTIAERKLPATSATIGFSYQVHEVWNCENSTA